MSGQDNLLALRASIAARDTPVLSTSAEFDPQTQAVKLTEATYIHFPRSKLSFALDSETRFKLGGEKSVDLRSIYFTWTNKDASVQDYLKNLQSLNEEIAAGPLGAHTQLHSLPFAERLDVNSWLSGSQDDSEYIVAATGLLASAAKQEFAVQPLVTDERLLAIKALQRDLITSTSILHGSKIMDFSHIRRIAAAYPEKPPPETTTLPVVGGAKSGGGGANSSTAPTTIGSITKPPTLPAAIPKLPTTAPTNKDGSSSSSSNKKNLSRPIVLLSPSASALVRMSNIRRFLEQGSYVPADSELAPSTDTNLLQLTRSMPSLDSSRPLRFDFCESTTAFKPETWSRVVAVVTTGQTWQFSAYRWNNAQDLFARVLGVYIGWGGEKVPDTVKSWGRSVKVVALEKWNATKGEQGRWKDREAVEAVWLAIEESMRAKGWNR